MPVSSKGERENGETRKGQKPFVEPKEGCGSGGQRDPNQQIGREDALQSAAALSRFLPVLNHAMAA
jgi:hypothetical protein